MQSIELTAKSVEEARQQAAAKLGVTPDQVDVVVIDETKGLFGKSQVRARCEVKAAAAPPAAKKPVARKTKEVAAKAAPKAEVAPEVPAPAAEERKPSSRRPRRDEKPAAAAAPRDAEEGEVDEVAASAADGDKLLAILRDLLSSADLQVSANVRDLSGKYVNIMLDGKDAAFLVGKHGEVLNALQYLLNIVSSRKITAGVRATLDANDYRKRREDALTKLATKIADQVMERQEEAVLDALPAFERRIVHKALSTITGISTYSEGEEPNRRVVIAPAE
jgi:spoIIIJ-associated protein